MKRLSLSAVCALLLGLLGCAGGSTTHVDAERGDDGGALPDSGAEVERDAAAHSSDGSLVDVPGADADVDADTDVDEFDGLVPILLQPSSTQTLYLHEALALKGSCGANTNARGRFELKPSQGGLPRFVEGTDVLQTFPAAGDFRVRLMCFATGGMRVASEAVDVHVRPTPQLVFSGHPQASSDWEHVYAVSVQELGKERQLSDEGEPSAVYGNLSYAASGAFVRVRVSGLPGAGDALVRACRSGDCGELPFVPFFQRADGCAPSLLTFSEDGKSAWAQYACNDLAETYWLDLTTPDATATLVTRGEAMVNYVLSGAAILYRSGTELRLFRPNDSDSAAVIASGVQHYASSPDGRRLVVVFRDRLEFYELSAEPLGAERTGELPLDVPPAYSFRAGASDDVLLIQQQEYSGNQTWNTVTVVAWDGSAQAKVCDRVRRCVVSVCGSSVLASPDTGIYLWDLSSWPSDVSPTVMSDGVSMNQTSPASFSPGCSHVSIPRWLPNVGARSMLLELSTARHTDQAPSTALLADNRLLRSDNAGLSVHTIGPGATLLAQPVVAFTDPTQRVVSVRISPDRKYIVFLADFERVGTWNAYSLRTEDLSLQRLAEGLPGYAEIAFSPDSRYVTFAGQPGWDAQTGVPAINRLREYELATSRLLWTSQGAVAGRAHFRGARRIGDTQRILFTGSGRASGELGLYAVDLTNDERTDSLVDVDTRTGLTKWELSPDGTALAFSRGSAVWMRSLLPEQWNAPPFAARVPEQPWLAPDAYNSWLVVSARGLLFEPTFGGELLWLDRSTGQSTSVSPAMAADAYRQLVAGPAPYGAVIERSRTTGINSLYLLAPAQANAPTLRYQGSIASPHYLSDDGRFLLYKFSDGGHGVLDLSTGVTRTLRSVSGEVVPSDLLSGGKDASRYADGRLALFGVWNQLRVVDLRKAELSHDVELQNAHVVGVSEDLTFAVTCQTDRRERAAFEKVVLATAAVTPLVNIPREDRDCSRPLLSPKGNWLFYRTQSGNAFLLQTDGSQQPANLGADVLSPSFDRAERYLVGKEGYSGPFFLWSTREPELGGRPISSRAFERTSELLWVD